MGLGIDVRLSRLFAHPSGNLFGIAVDHFVGYGNIREGGLKDLPGAVEQCMQASPDTMTMTPGTAKHVWGAYAGQGARGAVVGRNIWGEADMVKAARAYAAVIHDGLDADQAITRA